MAHCPHCNVRYDETNETQPCCYKCGHPISCGCGGGHSYSPSPSSPPPAPQGISDESGPGDENGEDDPPEESFSADDDLPF